MTDDLTALWARYPATVRPLSAPEPLGNAGGLSGARLWRFASARGLFVARAWPRGVCDVHRVEQVHRWQAESAHLGFVPVPAPAIDGRTFVEHAGAIWELAPWMPGTADLGRPPALARLRSGFAGLAAFHQSLAHHATHRPSPGLALRAREIDDLEFGGFLALDQALSLRSADPFATLARRWLALARLLAPRVASRLATALETAVPLQPCLRDVRPHHLLFEGDRLTGLVDFGAMDVDTVAGDLARLLLEWVGPDRAARAESLAAYTAVRALSPAETGLIDAFETSSALLTGGHWLRWHLIDGRTFEDPSAVTQGLERGLSRLLELAERQTLR
jgi:Ser/Thr protein kinase RdoA (MazF antagonist)